MGAPPSAEARLFELLDPKRRDLVEQHGGEEAVQDDYDLAVAAVRADGLLGLRGLELVSREVAEQDVGLPTDAMTPFEDAGSFSRLDVPRLPLQGGLRRRAVGASVRRESGSVTDVAAPLSALAGFVVGSCARFALPFDVAKEVRAARSALGARLVHRAGHSCREHALLMGRADQFALAILAGPCRWR